MELWEILVPTQYNGWGSKQIPVDVHREWDKFVRNLSGGLTILTPVKGEWDHEDKTIRESMIPVRIACSEEQIRLIIDFTLAHYKQKAVMAYRLSDKVLIIHEPV